MSQSARAVRYWVLVFWLAEGGWRMRGLGVFGGVRVVVAALLAGILAALLPSLAAVASSGSGPGRRPGSALLYPALFGVAATSAADAWAVGQYQDRAGALRTLIEHWNGTAWTRVTSPDPVPGGDTLAGVAAVSAADAWAVGGENGQPLIVHWDGTTWRPVTSPVLANGGALAGVTATSATDAWAVGLGGPGSGQTVIEHWDGTAWRLVPSPVTTGNLLGVTATSASDAWAVGFSGNWMASRALAEHWNGTAWTKVRCPNPPGSGNLLGVAATSATGAWAVSGAAQQAIGVNKTVTDHWNGTTWTRLPSPNPVPGGAILFAVAAATASDAWAVGADTDFVTSYHNVIEHWNGTTWTLAHSPVQDGSLYAVTATSATSAWAVGATIANRALIEHWNGTRWSATTVH